MVGCINFVATQFSFDKEISKLFKNHDFPQQNSSESEISGVGSKAVEENKNMSMCRTIFEFVCGKWKKDNVMKDSQIKFVEAW